MTTNPIPKDGVRCWCSAGSMRAGFAMPFESFVNAALFLPDGETKSRLTPITSLHLTRDEAIKQIDFELQYWKDRLEEFQAMEEDAKP